MSKNCLTFPVVLDGGVTGNGQAEINQIGFIYVILRGFDGCQGNLGACIMYLELVDVQTSGNVGQNPGGNISDPVATALCGIDHDTQDNRCQV
jgi:hypothetical protein